MSSSNNSSSKQSNSGSSSRKGGEFLCRIRYKNPLPDVPFPAKLLSHPVDESRLAEYTFTDWEKRMTYPLLPDDSLGMPFQVIDTSIYDIGAPPKLDPEDDILLKPPADNAENEGENVSNRYRPAVPWLRRTEYISSEAKLAKRKTDNVEKLRLQEQLAEQPDLLDNSLESRVEAIKRSFSAAAELDSLVDVKHPTKRDVHAVSTIPVFPNFENWEYKYALCRFDGDPLVSRSGTHAGSSILKVFSGSDAAGSDSNSQFIVLYAPVSANGNAMDVDGEEDEKHFVSLKQYTFNMDVDQADIKKLVFVVDDDKATFNPVNAKFALKKRRNAKKSKLHHNMDIDEEDVRIPTDISLKYI